MDLVEFEPTQAEDVITILLSELLAYGFLREQFKGDLRERRLAAQLQSIIAAARYDPPWVRDLAAKVQSPEEEIRRVLGKCAVQRQVYQIVKDLFYHPDTVRELRSELQTLYRRHNVILAAEFRDAIGIGRKRSIQLLEFFDRVGYTRRIPQGRIVRADSSWHESP